MAIGTSKVGALGGLVPGGSETFNTSGTFCVPPGVKKVSITGLGSPGNPGNPGNAGNPGTPGTGGAGASGAGSQNNPGGPYQPGPVGGRYAKVAFFNNPAAQFYGVCNPIPYISPFVPAPPSVTGDANNGTAGQTGCAGSAGSAGNPGNTGQASSGLSYTFCGGAGGNAGNAGNAGSGGPGGTGGSAGVKGNWQGGAGNGGAGGNAGGSGGKGSKGGPGFPSPNITRANMSPFGLSTYTVWGGGGGGGAGVNTGGSSAIQWNFTQNPGWANPTQIIFCQVGGGAGGAGSNLSRTVAGWTVNNGCVAVGGGGIGHPASNYNVLAATSPCWAPLNNVMTGMNQMPLINNNGRYTRVLQTGINTAPNPHWGMRAAPTTCPQFQSSFCTMSLVQPSPAYPQGNPVQWIPAPIRANAARAGAGGGAGAGFQSNNQICTQQHRYGGGGGGGGGRGSAGGGGGAGGTGGCGVAATPVTHNCVSVTPGCSYPIVVNTGGSVTISWNPQ